MPAHQYVTMASEHENAILLRSTNVRALTRGELATVESLCRAHADAAAFALASLSLQGPSLPVEA